MTDPYAAEAEERWGRTAAYLQSKQRTEAYRDEDWEALRAEADALTEQFVAAMTAGEAPSSTTAMDLAERHRQHISRWFYDCPPPMHAGLGSMYVADARFTEAIDAAAVGLAVYMAEAFTANAKRSE